MALRLDIEIRLSPDLISMNDEPWLRAKARKAATCVFSRKPIAPGDLVYRPLNNSKVRSARIRADELEAEERRINEGIVKRKAER